MRLPASATTLITCFSLVLVALVFLLVPPIPQDQNYHLFADERTLFGIPNFWNVVSNAPFLVVGLWGLKVAATTGALRPVYIVFFVGILLTAFGSAYYHWTPQNEPLVWDRLPMTIAIMGLLVAVIGEYTDLNVARRLLWPLLLAGLASVAYWHWTEVRGAGDLRPYAIVQFLPMLIMLPILAFGGKRSALTKPLWLMLAFYTAAKLLEHFDASIFSWLSISGHSLKHVFAAIGPVFLLLALEQRKSTQSGQGFSGT